MKTINYSLKAVVLAAVFVFAPVAQASNRSNLLKQAAGEAFLVGIIVGFPYAIYCDYNNAVNEAAKEKQFYAKVDEIETAHPFYTQADAEARAAYEIKLQESRKKDQGITMAYYSAANIARRSEMESIGKKWNEFDAKISGQVVLSQLARAVKATKEVKERKKHKAELD